MYDLVSKSYYNLKYDWQVKFMYFEKATKFCEISTVDLSYVVTFKSKVEISHLTIYELWYLGYITLIQVRDLLLRCSSQLYGGVFSPTEKGDKLSQLMFLDILLDIY